MNKRLKSRDEQYTMSESSKSIWSNEIKCLIMYATYRSLFPFPLVL